MKLILFYMSEPIAPIGHQTMSFFFQPISEIQYLGADTKCRATYQKILIFNTNLGICPSSRYRTKESGSEI